MTINALLKKSIAEFLGVLMFLSSIVAAVANSGSDRFAAHVALAATLGLAILLTAGVSGGHLNPAVSLYFYAKKAISLSELGAYIVAQLAGALVGAFIGAQIVGKSLTGFTTSSAAPSAAAIIGELFATGGLVWLIGRLASTKHGHLIPGAVGLWVFAVATFTPTGDVAGALAAQADSGAAQVAAATSFSTSRRAGWGGDIGLAIGRRQQGNPGNGVASADLPRPTEPGGGTADAKSGGQPAAIMAVLAAGDLDLPSLRKADVRPDLPIDADRDCPVRLRDSAACFAQLQSQFAVQRRTRPGQPVGQDNRVAFTRDPPFMAHAKSAMIPIM